MPVADDDRFLAVIAHLLATQDGARLVRIAAHSASVLRADGSTIEIASAGGGTIEQLGEHLRALVDRDRRHATIVLVGGSDAHRREASNARPAFAFGRRVDVCGIDDAGTAWWDEQTRAKSPIVADLRALDLATAAPADRERLTALVQPLPEPTPGAAAKEDLFGSRATLTVAALCIAIGALQWLWASGDWGLSWSTGEPLVREPWRVLSSGWLHLGLTHVFSNVLVLLVAGHAYERRVGWQRFVVLYTLAVGIGSLGSALAWESDFDSVGASAGVWGVLGALVVVASRPTESRLRPAVYLGVGVMVGLEFVGVLLLGGRTQGMVVDFYAHAAGLVAGLVFEAILPQRPLKIGAAIAIALHVVALVLALATARPWAGVAGKLEETTTHELREVAMVIDVPSSLGPPGFGDEGDVRRYTFGDPTADLVILEIMFEAHDLGLADPADSSDEMDSWRELEREGGLRSIHDIEGVPWPTFEGAIVHEQPHAEAVIVWCQLHPHDYVVMSGRHPEGDDSVEALRAAMRSLRPQP